MRRSMYVGNGPCSTGTGLRRLHTATALPNVGAYTYIGWCYLHSDRSQPTNPTLAQFQVLGGLDTVLDTSWCQIGINSSGASVCTTVSSETAFSANFPIGSWFPFAIVGDGDVSGSASAYFIPPGDPGDGSTMLTATASPAPTTAGAPTTDFSIGGASNVDTEWMDASFSNCMLYSVAFTSAQVKAQLISKSGAPIITSNLYAYWKIYDQTNFGLDSSSSNHNITVLDNPIYGPTINFSDDPGGPLPNAVGIVYEAPGTESVSAGSGTTVTPGCPTVVKAGYVLVMVVGQKPTTANGGGVTTPDGWTLQTSLTGANDGNTGGYGTGLAVNTGNMNAFFYTRVADGTEGGTTVTVNLTNNNVAYANIYAFSNFSGKWLFAGTAGKKTVGNASVSAAMAVDEGGASSDHYIGFWCVPTAVNSPGQKYTVHAFAQSGLVFSGVAEAEEYFETNGNDAGGCMFQGPVGSGTSAGVATLSLTASGITTNMRGPMLLLRLRQLSSTALASSFLELF